MQSGLTSTDGPVAAALADWRRAPRLAPMLADPAGVYLVLDADDGRILHASPAARTLADALAEHDAPGLARQAARAAPRDGSPCLARLHVDPRRIAPPVLCLIAAAAGDAGVPAILVVPTGPVTLRPARPVRAAERPVEPVDPAPAVEPARTPSPTAPSLPESGDRFLWRTDAAGVITALTGGAGLAGLAGRSWADLAGSGLVTGADTALSALGERRTFRAAPAELHLAGLAPLAVELSGAPVGRGEAAFAGFGLIRGIPQPAPEMPADADDGSAPDPAVPVAAASSETPDPALSTDEHAAFREIARALGARYAGDDEPEAGEPGAARIDGGAVMPFPGLPERPPVAEPAVPSREDGALFDGLPVPALLLRGAAILAANRRFLNLTGFPDAEAVRAAGLDRLFRGRPPEAGIGGRTAIAAADGRARPVEIVQGACTWEGEAADCLILRPLGEDDAAGALDAERLARVAQAARTASAEAALDAVEAGVVTVDAAALFGCDPREVVGGGFLDLFEAADAQAAAMALRGGDGDRIALPGRSLALRVSPPRADGIRVAVLDRASRAADAMDAAAAGPDAVLARLERELRSPMRGIVDLTEEMLREPFGPLGDPRYRGCLSEIKASGERVLERVAELLDLAAVEAGRLELHPRPLALNELVAGCVARLQPEAARGRIVLRTSFSSELDELEADEPSVSRAASLVIEHAIRRSAAGGQVIVSTGAAESAEIALRVRDTAAGRPDAAAPHPQDLGDGLALPRALVQANGGRLRLANRGDDDGHLVEIILPARRAAGG